MADASARATWLFVCAAVLLSFEGIAVGELLAFVPRNFSGVGNNIANPSWGSAGITQVLAVQKRAVACTDVPTSRAPIGEG